MSDVPLIVIIGGAAVVALVVLAVVLVLRARRRGDEDEPAGSFLGSRPQDTFAGLGEPEARAGTDDDEFRLDWGHGEEDLPASRDARREGPEPATSGREAEGGRAAVEESTAATQLATKAATPATEVEAATEPEAATESDTDAGVEPDETVAGEAVAGEASGEAAGADAQVGETAAEAAAAGGAAVGDAETEATAADQPAEQRPAPRDVTPGPAVAEAGEARDRADLEGEDEADDEGEGDARPTIPAAAVQERHVPRMVPLSDIIVTTSRKTVDLDDPEVRRMLTELVRYEIDQAAEFSVAGQSVDAVLQLTEAEKVSRALGMDETAERIKTMMRELQV